MLSRNASCFEPNPSAAECGTHNNASRRSQTPHKKNSRPFVRSFVGSFIPFVRPNTLLTIFKRHIEGWPGRAVLWKINKTVVAVTNRDALLTGSCRQSARAHLVLGRWPSSIQSNSPRLKPFTGKYALCSWQRAAAGEGQRPGPERNEVPNIRDRCFTGVWPAAAKTYQTPTIQLLEESTINISRSILHLRIM